MKQNPSDSGKIIQISISRGGVPKFAVDEAEITKAGMIGNAFAKPFIHGGPKKALLIVTAEGIEELRGHGFDLYPGALGENLTIEGIDRREMRIGQQYQTGAVRVQIETLRWPCSTLRVYGEGIEKALVDSECAAGDPSSRRWGLSGFYASILQEGRIRTGEPFERIA